MTPTNPTPAASDDSPANDAFFAAVEMMRNKERAHHTSELAALREERDQYQRMLFQSDNDKGTLRVDLSTAQADVERLTKELGDRQASLMMTGGKLLKEAREESAALRTQLSEAKADGERLDWLENDGRCAKFSDGWNVWKAIDGKEITSVAETLRAAIDTARTPKPLA